MRCAAVPDPNYHHFCSPRPCWYLMVTPRSPQVPCPGGSPSILLTPRPCAGRGSLGGRGRDRGAMGEHPWDSASGRLCPCCATATLPVSFLWRREAEQAGTAPVCSWGGTAGPSQSAEAPGPLRPPQQLPFQPLPGSWRSRLPSWQPWPRRGQGWSRWPAPRLLTAGESVYQIVHPSAHTRVPNER